MHRTITGVVAVFAALALTGCAGGSDTAAPPKASPSPSPEKQDLGTLLPASLKKIQSESFKFTSTVTVDGHEITTEGAFDLAEKLGTATVDMGEDVSFELRIIGEDMYMTNPIQPEQWMHLDLGKLPAGSMFGRAANPVSNADYLFGVSDDVKQVGDGTYEGTLDLRKYLDEHATPEEKKELEKALGDAGPDALKVPFEATVDGEGRLTEIKTTMTLNVEGKKTTVDQVAKYFDFGAKVDVEKPSGKIQEAPEAMYEQ